jgi:hypothetical protein
MIGPDKNGEFERIIGPDEELAQKMNSTESRPTRRERKLEKSSEEPKVRTLTMRRKSKDDLRWYKRAAFVLPMAGAIAISGVAAAFFIAEGSGTGTTSVPTATASSLPVTVTSAPAGFAQLGAEGGALTPTSLAGLASCGCADVAQWKITSTSAAQISTLTPTVVAGTGGVVENAASGNALVPGCLASWFVPGPATLTTGSSWNPGNNIPLPATLTPGASNQYVGSTVYILDNGATQNQCAGVSPLLSLSVG